MPSQFSTFLSKQRKETPLILIVDDNEDNILFASSALQLLNFDCIVANGGKKAIEIAKDELPDLILLDIIMPNISGIEVTRILKHNPQTAHIPIVAVTGLTYPIQLQKIVDAGCNDYLCKPYLIKDLAEKLSNLIGVGTDRHVENYRSR